MYFSDSDFDVLEAARVVAKEEAIAAVDVKLTDEEIARLEAPYVTHPVIMPGAAQAQKAETRGST